MLALIEKAMAEFRASDYISDYINASSFNKRCISSLTMMLVIPFLAGCLDIRDPISSESKGICSGKIAYVGDGVDGKSDLFIINKDGSNKLNLTRSPDFSGHPSWSPDGERLALIEGKSLMLIDVRSMEKTRLDNLEGLPFYPSWSPDGKQIVVLLRNKFDATQYQLKILDSETLQVDSLFDFLNDNLLPMYGFKSSPDNQEIVFGGLNVIEERFHVYLMDIEGGNVKKLTDSLVAATAPDWSPDGQQIIFWGGTETRAGVYIMKKDGSSLKEVKLEFDKQENAGYPVWSPDGQEIAFFANNSFYRANLDGSDVRRIVEIEDIIGHERSDKRTFDWQPVKCSKNS